MKLIKPHFELMEQEVPVRKFDDSNESYKLRLLDSVYKQIELAGRTCYKSTDKITDESAKPFVDRMIASQHYAMLEHGTVYLRIPFQAKDVNNYSSNSYSKLSFIRERLAWFITTNLRVIVENHWEDDLQYICAPTRYHDKRYTVKFICNRQVSHEFVRHKLLCVA